MDKSVELSPEDRQQFNEIFEAIGLTQTELATRAGVSQSWLSQSVFTGYRHNTNTEMLERLVVVMAELLKSRPPDKKFSEERTASALAFLSRFSATAAADVNASKIYPAGGIVPLDAAYYVEREDADGKITEALRKPYFTMIVRGPVQCGKSSLLARLEQKALEKGVKTAWFDPGNIPKEKHQADTSTNAAIALAELLQNKWRLTPPRSEIISLTNFINWLMPALAPMRSEPRLLVLDNLASLGAYGVEEWLLSFVREMSNKRSKLGQISIAVGLTYHLGPDFSHRILEQSSYVNWNTRIDLDWFKFEGAVKLEEAIQGDTAKAKTLFELFGGQPYLTHAAAADDEFLDSVQRWDQEESESDKEFIQSHTAYRQHRSAIRSTILGPDLEISRQAQRLLETFANLGSGGVISYYDDEVFFGASKLIKETYLFERLKKTGMTSPVYTPKRPTISLPIYRLMANDFKEALRGGQP